MNSRNILALGGVLVALATLLGAFGAHALQARLTPDRLAVYETAVRYHFFHALGLLAIGATMLNIDSRMLATSAWLILAGLVLFSGSIYILTFGAPRFIAMITPLGGSLLMVGWVLFAIAVLRR